MKNSRRMSNSIAHAELEGGFGWGKSGATIHIFLLSLCGRWIRLMVLNIAPYMAGFLVRRLFPAILPSVSIHSISPGVCPIVRSRLSMI